MHTLRSLSVFAALLAALLAALAPGVAGAQADSTRPPAVVTRGDLGWLALTAGVAALAQRGDAAVRREVRGAEAQESGALGALADVGNSWGQPGVVLVGAAMWGGGLYARNATVATVGLRALESITVSSVVTKVLKGTFGRARPRVSPTDAWDVELGRGFRSGRGDYESFPSGHSTAAFAFAAAVTSEVVRRAPRHARLVGATTFTMAAFTAYARMHRDAHWLSDVAMGAGIGTVSGWAVTRWHATRPENRVDRILLEPMLTRSLSGTTHVGVTLSWR